MDNGLQVNLRGRWASTALFLFEIIITLDKEIDLVWLGKWTLPRTAYFVARYVGFATSLFTTIVAVLPFSNANAVELALLCTILVASETLLLLRVSALCADRSQGIWGISYFYVVRRHLWGLYFAIVAAVGVLVTVEFVVSLRNVGPPDKLNFGCFTQNGPPDYTFYVMIVIVWLFDGILFAVTLLKLGPTWRNSSASKLPFLILRDGSFYFAVNFVVYGMLSAVIAIVHNDPYTGTIFTPWTIIIPPIMSCRLFLNIKAFGASVKTPNPSFPVTVAASKRAEALLTDLESRSSDYSSRGQTDSWDI